MKKTALLVLSSFFCSAAFAADIPAQSKISAVTVFPDRADVSRSGTAQIPAGKHTLVFDNLPFGLMTDSLRVSGKGAFTIGSVETKIVYTSEPVAAQEKEIQERIAVLRDERRFIESQIKAADTGKAFLENLTRADVTPRANEDRQTPAPAVWKTAWQTIQNGMNALGRESIEHQIKLRSIDAETAALQNRLRMIATGRKSYKQVRVNVETAAPVKAGVVLQYRISGARWNPLYEARLNSDSETVDLVQYGNISQNTGEDWNNVALTLSTARPSATMRPSVPDTVWLDLERSEPVVYKTRSARVASSKMMMASNFAVADEMAALGAAMPESAVAEDVDAGYSGASAVGTEFSGVYAIKGTSNVPSDGAQYRFNIGAYNAKAEIRAETYPASDASAYLIATLVYKGELPLLAGDAALFRDGAFIGNSQLDFLRPDEKLHLAFGQDEKIRVTYTSLGGKTKESGVLSKDNTKESLSKAAVQNLHRRPIKIAVYEPLPVSRNGDVTVKIVKDATTPDYTVAPNDKVGLVKWESVYQPREKREINYGYAVTWPKDGRLTGM